MSETTVSGTTDRRVAYLVLSHENAPQVEALVARILALSPTGRVVVHHDAADTTEPWAGRPPARVRLVERHRLAWGDWSIVATTLRMVAVARDELDADWFVVVSGMHWPVTDLAGWERSLGADGAGALAESRPLPERLRFGRGDDDANRFLARCRHRWVPVPLPRRRVGRRAFNALVKGARWVQPVLAVESSHARDVWFLGLPRRQRPMAGWTFHKGTQWTAFDRRAADALLGVDPAVLAWFRQGHIADETFVPTVLHHTPGLAVSDRLATYVPPGPERPVVERWMHLTLDSLPAVWASGAAFARKVDLGLRPEVVAAIDTAVDGRLSAPVGAAEGGGSP